MPKTIVLEYLMIKSTLHRPTKYDISLKTHVICDRYHSVSGLYSRKLAKQARQLKIGRAGNLKTVSTGTQPGSFSDSAGSKLHNAAPDFEQMRQETLNIKRHRDIT